MFTFGFWKGTVRQAVKTRDRGAGELIVVLIAAAVCIVVLALAVVLGVI